MESVHGGKKQTTERPIYTDFATAHREITAARYQWTEFIDSVAEYMGDKPDSVHAMGHVAFVHYMRKFATRYASRKEREELNALRNGR